MFFAEMWNNASDAAAYPRRFFIDEALPNRQIGIIIILIMDFLYIAAIVKQSFPPAPKKTYF